MTTNLRDQNNYGYAVVEAPRWGDAEFVGKWLIAAGKADRLWQAALNSEFHWYGLPLERICEVDLARHAFVHAMKVREGRASFTVKIDNENVASGDQFALLVRIGFFMRVDRQYRMTIPVRLNI